MFMTLCTPIDKIFNLQVVISNTMIKNDNHSMTKCHKIFAVSLCCN